MITLTNLDARLIEVLPELAHDLSEYRARCAADTEFEQSFFGYSFVPTLQAALDRDMKDFCRRAFVLLEELVSSGDPEVQILLEDEFFAYGPACEKWMRRAVPQMGPRTRAKAIGSLA